MNESGSANYFPMVGVMYSATMLEKGTKNTHGGPIEGKQESKTEVGESITSSPTQRLQNWSRASQ